MPDKNDYRVYVIESPSDKDIFEGLSAGGMLKQALDIAKIQAKYRLVVNHDWFIEAFMEMLKGFLNQQEVPILHIIAHGNDQEIGFTSGQRISHADLGECLRLANEALGGELIVCLSSCDGFKLTRSGFNSNAAPFATLVGNMGKPSWGDNIVGFTAFYYLLARGKTIKDAVEGMKMASGNIEFRTIDGDEIKRLKDMAAKMDPARIRSALQELTKKQKQGSPS